VQLKLNPEPTVNRRLCSAMLFCPLIVTAPDGSNTIFPLMVLELPSAQMPQFSTVLLDTTVSDAKAMPTPADIPGGAGCVITRLPEIEPFEPCKSIPPYTALPLKELELTTEFCLISTVRLGVGLPLVLIPYESKSCTLLFLTVTTFEGVVVRSKKIPKPYPLPICRYAATLLTIPEEFW